MGDRRHRGPAGGAQAGPRRGAGGGHAPDAGAARRAGGRGGRRPAGAPAPSPAGAHLDRRGRTADLAHGRGRRGRRLPPGRHAPGQHRARRRADPGRRGGGRTRSRRRRPGRRIPHRAGRRAPPGPDHGPVHGRGLLRVFAGAVRSARPHVAGTASGGAQARPRRLARLPPRARPRGERARRRFPAAVRRRRLLSARGPGRDRGAARGPPAIGSRRLRLRGAASDPQPARTG